MPVSRATTTGFYLAPASALRSCHNASLAVDALDYLDAIQFVSAQRGWVVGEHEILATSDGGRHWTVQERGDLDLVSVDFVSARTGWALGPDMLLTTADGGTRWTALHVPCLNSLDFLTRDFGFAISGGNGLSWPADAHASVVRSTNGGRSWESLATPANPQTVCFDNPSRGWLGADGNLYRTSDGGRRWTLVTAAPSAGDYAMDVQCAGAGSVWAQDTGLIAGMNQAPQVGYYADRSGSVPLFASRIFPRPRVPVRTGSEPPGPDGGPLAAISPTSAVFSGYCPACGLGSVSWNLVTGTAVARDGDVTGIEQAEAASFVSPQRGWVLGVVIRPGRKGSFQQRIIGTTDGGRTWRVLYRS